METAAVVEPRPAGAAPETAVAVPSAALAPFAALASFGACACACACACDLQRLRVADGVLPGDHRLADHEWRFKAAPSPAGAGVRAAGAAAPGLAGRRRR